MGMLGTVIVVMALAACESREPEPDDKGEPLRLTIDPNPPFVSAVHNLTARFTRETGIPVDVVPAPQNITERLNQYHQLLASPGSRMDLYMIDVIWTREFPGRFVDLSQSFADDIADFFPSIIENNTVAGELVALPWFASAGLLYYRADLLEKYGYQHPPRTLGQLEEMAAAIQEGERAEGHTDFHGYIWQAAPLEALTCNFVEWYAAHGGGTLQDDSGGLAIDPAIATRSIGRAAGWLATISPPDLPSWSENRVRESFREGNVAFLRHWPFGIRYYGGGDSPVADRTGVAPLPGSPSASALGGWQLALSRQSRQPENALRLLRFLLSPESQHTLAHDAGFLPTRPALYGDEALLEEIPSFPILREIFETATPRPSREFGRNYNAFSALVQQTLLRVFEGDLSAEQAADIIQDQGRRLLPE